MENNFLIPQNTAKTSELYMTFSLSGKSYSILAERILEIVQLPALHILEKVPEYIVGLMNIRGKVISVIDLRRILGIDVTSYSTENQILIIKIKDKTLGIIVDSVDDVIQLAKEELEPLPYHSEDGFIHGIYKGAETLVAFLNLDAIFADIETIQHEDSTNLQLPATIFSDLFPSDEFSQQKFKKRALNLQKEIKEEISKNDYREDRFVSFNLNDEKYCLSLKYVKEFCKSKHFSLIPVPCTPEYIVGLINLRGEFITVVDIKSFLQIQKTNITEKTKIIVVKSPDLQIGLLVDEVFDILNIPVENLICETPAKFERNKYTSAEVVSEDGVMSVLDLEKLLEDERLFIEDAV